MCSAKALEAQQQISRHVIVLSFLFVRFVLNEITVKGFDFFDRPRCSQKGYWR